MTINDTIKITKGNRDWDIQKGDRAKIVKVEVHECNSAFVTLSFLTGFKAGKTLIRYVRHVNRLNDVICRVHNGDPTQTIEFVLYKAAPTTP